MQEKNSYTLQELFDNLPVSLRRLSQLAGISEVTAASIRDGGTAQRNVINKLLTAMASSEVYNRPLTVYNVTGISIKGKTPPASGSDSEKAA